MLMPFLCEQAIIGPVGSERVIYACDIGSTRNRGKNAVPAFAWVRLNPNKGISSLQGSSDIQQLVKTLKIDIENRYSIALGFEAPLFIPVPDDTFNLSKARYGEGARSFASQMGLAVSALVVHQSAWILKRLCESTSGKCKFTLDPHCWPPSSHRPILFCWEAFVSEKAHSDQGIRDAASAVVFFFNNEQNLREISAVSAENAVSLIGAVAFWNGWVSSLRYPLIAMP